MRICSQIEGFANAFDELDDKSIGRLEESLVHSKDIKISESRDVMTVERLREHLFGGPQVPFWNYDPAQITIGMEIEYFIAKVHGDSFTLATKAQYLSVIEYLKKDAGYKDMQLNDQPGRVSRDTELGFIAIKPDFAWHILEISLPPRKNLEDLKSLLENVFLEVDRALAKVGLQRLDLSCLPEVPEKMELVELDRLSDIKSTFNQKILGKPTIDPHFPAYIAATHIHVNAGNEHSIAILPKLFQIDSNIAPKFSRAQWFEGRHYDNVRTNFYADTLGDQYYLHTIPRNIPDSITSLVSLMNESKFLFPKDGFFPVRNMSYIRPSRYGTIEFRSSCSFKDLQKLIDIARWRCAQLIVASGDLVKSESADLFISKAVSELKGCK